MGCGSGHVLTRFPDAALTAVDVSPIALRAAEVNLRGFDVEFVRGDGSDLNGQFDRVICTEVLEHVSDPRAMLSTIRRLLAPDGIAGNYSAELPH